MAETDREPSRSPRWLRGGSTLFIVVGGTFGLQGLMLVSGIITARLLGVEGRGIIALVFAMGLMASQLSFGGSLPVAVAKNIAERQVAARDGLRSLARRRGWLILVPSFTAGAFMLFMQRDAPTGERFALAAAVVVLALQTIVFRILIGSLQGEVGHLARMVAVGIAPQLIYTVALTTAWIAGWQWSPLAVLISFFLASFIGIAVGFRALATPTRRPEDGLDETELWSQTRKTYISSVRPADGLGLDRILIGSLMGLAPLGLYAVALAVGSLSGLIGSSMAVIVLPRVAQRAGDPAAQRALARRWAALTAALLVVVVLVLEAVLAPAIRIVFGEEFVGATECARWLVIAAGLLGFRMLLIAVLQGQGRGGTSSWIELALAPVMLVGVVLACLADDLPAVGIAMAVVGAIGCAVQGMAVFARSGRRRAQAQPVNPPAETIT